MRKWRAGLIVLLVLCLIPVFQALASTGTVTASSLNMRKSASSSSDVVKVLKKGTSVTVLSSKSGWYKIKAGGETGYVAKKYISIGSSSSSKSSSGSSKSSSSNKSSSSKSSKSSSSGTCSVGDQGNAVKAVQKKLKNLGFYSGTVDGDYGSGTKKAVLAFQKKNGLKQTGNVNSATLEKMNSKDVKKANSSSSSSGSSSKSSSGSSNGTCSVGDKGSAVKAVQRKLKNLGFYNGTVDGDYGPGTKNAVKAFQKKNGLKQTGNVNSTTLNKMNSKDVKKAGSSSSDGGSSSTTEALYWFKGGSNKIPKGATFQVKDIKTGKVFTCRRWSGANHCDTEPKTAKDTSIMKSIYGHWSWKRRSILVKYNGHVYAASMNGMPHGTGTISNNKFDGHFCIHFLGSKTHGSKKVDSAHQSCVKNALKHSW